MRPHLEVSVVFEGVVVLNERRKDSRRACPKRGRHARGGEGSCKVRDLVTGVWGGVKKTGGGLVVRA